ncbi:hypothetical protein ACOSQ4_016948 [Xanthoceras sorbifolium]
MDEDKKIEDGNHSNSSGDDEISLLTTTTNSVEHFSDEYGGGQDNINSQPVGAGAGGYPVGASASWSSATAAPQYHPVVNGVQSR